MKAAVLHKANDLRLQEVAAPSSVGPDDIRVRVRSVGVCGSDVHFFEHGRIGDFVVRQPMILGHESAGEVVEVGSAVTGLRVGDRVAMEPGVPCRKCPRCREGRYNLCPEVRFWACPPVDGSLAEYVVHPADYSFVLPESLSTAEGAMIEPLAVGVHACALAGIRNGDSVAVLGAGPIGLLALQVAMVQGATHTIVSDVSAVRLKMAESLGATVTTSPQEASACVLEATDGQGADVVLECSGAVEAVTQAPDLVRAGGVVVWIGMPASAGIPLDIVKLEVKEARTLGVFRYANAYGRAVALAATGRVRLRPLITAHYPLDQAVEAVQVCAGHALDQIKTVIDL